jgi:DNA-binding response OmpR family regulator
MKVLLVDDQTRFVSILTRRLNMRGIDAECVFSPEEALKLVDTTHYDVAVLDVKMPGLSGIELRRELQKKDANMKYIFVTGHACETDYKAGVQEASFYLPKPLNIDKLIEAIQITVLDK